MIYSYIYIYIYIYNSSYFINFIYYFNFSLQHFKTVLLPFYTGNMNYDFENIILNKECVSYFLGSWEMNRSVGQTVEVVFGRFFRSAHRFISHEPKRHLFLIFTMFPTRTLSKILIEKFYIQNSHSNGHLFHSMY